MVAFGVLLIVASASVLAMSAADTAVSTTPMSTTVIMALPWSLSPRVRARSRAIAFISYGDYCGPIPARA